MKTSPPTTDSNGKLTVPQVARHVGKTPSRIRQICRRFDIGKLHGGRVRLLTLADLRKVERYIAKSGKDFS